MDEDGRSCSVCALRCAAVSLRMLPDSAQSTACQTGDTDNLPSRDRCARYVTRAYVTASIIIECAKV